MFRQVTQCPVCDAALRTTELSCSECDTKLHGYFDPPPLARLAREHQGFIETFVLCRGIIRDVEKVLGVSYPTVRARLDAAVDALEAVQAAPPPRAPRAPASSVGGDKEGSRLEILRQVGAGTIDPARAAEALRHL